MIRQKKRLERRKVVGKEVKSTNERRKWGEDEEEKPIELKKKGKRKRRRRKVREREGMVYQPEGGVICRKGWLDGEEQK